MDSTSQWTWRTALAVVLVETILVWAYVALLALAGNWRLVGYFAMWAVAFAGLAFALARRRRWVRAPLIVLQFLLAASGVTAGSVGLGVVLVVLALAATGFLMAPATRATLGAG